MLLKPSRVYVACLLLRPWRPIVRLLERRVVSSVLVVLCPFVALLLKVVLRECGGATVSIVLA